MDKIKFYLSSRYSRRDEMREVREALTSLGHIVLSRWLDTCWDESDGTSSSSAPPSYREEYAIKDMEDVALCEALIAFTEPPKSDGRGGRHVEFGMAAAWGKKLIVVGPQENIFHHLPDVKVFNTLEDLLNHQWINTSDE